MKIIEFNADRPNYRELRNLVKGLENGGVAIIPGDSGYTLVGDALSVKSSKAIRVARDIKDSQHLTLLLSDYRLFGKFAELSNFAFRLVKNNRGGTFTYLLKAKSSTTKTLLNQKRKTVGLRETTSPIILGLLKYYPDLVLTTASIPQELVSEDSIVEPSVLQEVFHGKVDWLVNIGAMPYDPTTVVDLTSDTPTILRQGKGNFDY